MTPKELLDEAVKDFEAKFAFVQMGEAGQTFPHLSGGSHSYLEVGAGGVRKEGASYPSHLRDTPEQAVAAWRDAVRAFEGNEFLYWRVKPEIDQWTDKVYYGNSPEGEPNPYYGKWSVYSRFRALS